MTSQEREQKARELLLPNTHHVGTQQESAHGKEIWSYGKDGTIHIPFNWNGDLGRRTPNLMCDGTHSSLTWKQYDSGVCLVTRE